MRCKGCGAALAVGVRQSRRIRAGHSGSLCRTCRGAGTPVVTDDDYRFWLTQYGVAIPSGMSAIEAVSASGLPTALRELAQDFAEDRYR